MLPIFGKYVYPMNDYCARPGLVKYQVAVLALKFYFAVGVCRII
jgi:hypothetical protein